MSEFARPGQCESQLRFILSDAQIQVKSRLPANSPCFNAAMIKRKNGSPGCFPGRDLSTLVSILNPVMEEVKAVCDSACVQEQKRTSCYELTSQSCLREIGILGVTDILKYPLVIDPKRTPQ